MIHRHGRDSLGRTCSGLRLSGTQLLFQSRGAHNSGLFVVIDYFSLQGVYETIVSRERGVEGGFLGVIMKFWG